MMDKTGVIIVLLLIALLAGIFGLAAWNNGIQVASAETKLAVAMDRQPAVERAAVTVGLSLTAKIVAGVVTSLALAALAWAWKATADLRRMREGGLDRFYQRRNPPKEKINNGKKTDLTELIKLQILNDLQKRR